MCSGLCRPPVVGLWHCRWRFWPSGKFTQTFSSERVRRWKTINLLYYYYKFTFLLISNNYVAQEYGGEKSEFTQLEFWLFFNEYVTFWMMLDYRLTYFNLN